MTSKLRAVFMGTPEFGRATLEALAASHEVLAVYTQPDRPVGRGLELRGSPIKQAALALGIPVLQPEKLTAPGEFEKLQALRPDVIVVVAYGQILKKAVLDLPRLGCINIHSSLLPRWRGAAPIQWAILAGDSVSGVCTMKMAEKLDAGDVYLREETPISAEDTAGTLHDRLAALAPRLLLKTLEEAVSGSLQGQRQDESQVTYASKLTKEMERLDPGLSAVELDRRVRALTPWPGTSIQVEMPGGPARLRVKAVKAHPKIEGSQGQLIERHGMVCLGTAQGCLELTRVQWDGKKESTSSELLNGLRGRGVALPLKVV